MHKAFIFGILYSFVVSYCLGQTVRVIEEGSGDPIEGAIIITQQPVNYVVTDENGKASHNSYQGKKELSIRALGYTTLLLVVDFSTTKEIDITLAPVLFNLDQVIVSASKWSQSVDNIPMKVIQIDPKMVELQNPQTAADLLGTSGKVFIQKSQQGGGSPMIRGFATNRLIYSIDGVRMNTAIFRSGNIQNVINLDPFSILSTEVLFGPGSVIYGSDAIGGVMSFQTKSPSLSNDSTWNSNLNISSRFSSANLEKTGHVDLELSNHRWGFLSSLSYWDFDDLTQGSQGPDDFLKTQQVVPSDDGADEIVDLSDPLIQKPSGYSQINLMQKVSFQTNDQLMLQYGFHFSETSSYSRYDRHNRQTGGLPQFAEWYYGPQSWRMHHFKAQFTKATRMYDEMRLVLSRQKFTESRVSRTLYETLRNIQTEQVLAQAINLDFHKKWNQSNTIHYGTEYVYNHVNSKGTIEETNTGLLSAGPSRYPQADWQSLGIYATNDREINEKWNLNSGLRINLFGLAASFDTTFYSLPFTTAQQSDASLTGSVGAVYRPSATWIININAGTAFRAPNVDDMGKVFDSEPGAVVVPNPELASEYAYNIDLGTTKIIFENLKLDMTGYYTWLNNAMVRRDFQLEGQDSIFYAGQLSKVQAIQNLSGAKVYGLQWGIELKTTSGMTFQSDLNIQRGIEENSNGLSTPARHVAPLFGVTCLRYQTKKLRLEVNTQYQGTFEASELPVEERSKTEIYALDKNGSTFSPGWYTLNFKSSWQMSSWLRLNVGLENITDQRYRSFSSGISGAGRNWVLSLSGNF